MARADLIVFIWNLPLKLGVRQTAACASPQAYGHAATTA
jgi:hypothetical protein